MPPLRALRPSLTSTPKFLSRTRHLATTTTATTPPIAAVAAAPLPRKKPAGAFRTGILGFLLGSTLAGAGTWFYIMEEYRVSNELLTEDIYALQAAVQRIHTLVLGLEERLVLAELKGPGGKK